MAGLCEAARGKTQQAVPYFRKADALAPGNAYFLGRLGNALGRSGQTAEALELAAQLEQQAQREFVPHLNLAWPYMGLSDRGRELEHLEAAARGRETDLLFLGVDSVYDPVRGEARFRKVAATVAVGQ